MQTQIKITELCSIAIFRRDMIVLFDQVLIYFVGIYFQRIL